MNVRELIERLSEMELDAAVVFVGGRRAAVEYDVCGVTTRAEVDRGRVASSPADDTLPGDGRRASDVMLLEGQRLRPGSNGAWCAVRTV